MRLLRIRYPRPSAAAPSSADAPRQAAVVITIVAVYAVVGVFLIAFGAGLGRRGLSSVRSLRADVAWLAARWETW